jgi:hypothetical protein
VELTYWDGEVVDLSFDSKLHAYRADGDPIPSATKVLGIIAKPALIPWALKNGSEWLERHMFVDDESEDKGMFQYTSRLTLDALIKGIKSAHRGTSGNAIGVGNETHQWIEKAVNQFIKDEGKFGDDNLPTLPVDPEPLNSVNAFMDWVGDHEIKFDKSEQRVYNRVDRYAGTVDCIADLNGVRTVIDWKTSKGIYPEYHLQVAAYAQAWEDMSGEQIDQTLVLRLDKASGRYQCGFQSRREWVDNYTLFCAALALHQGLKKLR